MTVFRIAGHIINIHIFDALKFQLINTILHHLFLIIYQWQRPTAMVTA